MGMSTGGGPGNTMSEINVTPFVDVMLVLLIIFMVASPLIQQEDDANREVDINLPVTKDNPNTVDVNSTDKFILKIDDKLIVRAGDAVLADCSAQLGAGKDPARFEPCFAQVENKLITNVKLQQDKTLYLLADTEIPYGFVVGIMNRVKKAGIANVGMVTNPEYLPKE